MACFAMEFPFQYFEISIEISIYWNKNFMAKHAIFPAFYLGFLIQILQSKKLNLRTAVIARIEIESYSHYFNGISIINGGQKSIFITDLLSKWIKECFCCWME